MFIVEFNKTKLKKKKTIKRSKWSKLLTKLIDDKRIKAVSFVGSTPVQENERSAMNGKSTWWSQKSCVSQMQTCLAPGQLILSSIWIFKAQSA